MTIPARDFAIDTEKGQSKSPSETMPGSGTTPDQDSLGTGNVLGAMQTLTPPANPSEAYRLDYWSSHLAPPRDSYVTSVHGYKMRFEPVIDLSGEDDKRGRSRVRELLEGQRLQELWESAGPDDNPFDLLDDTPTVEDEELDTSIRRLRRRQKAETSKLGEFFGKVYPEGTLTSLRSLLGSDRFLTGGYWLAVARDRRGVPARFSRLPPEEMRFTTQGTTEVLFRRIVRDGVSGLKTMLYPQYPRLIVQLSTGTNRRRYYRMWGDTRFIDANSGRALPRSTFSSRGQRSTSGTRTPTLATEVLFVPKMHSASRPYGLPTWWSSRVKVENSIKEDQVVSQHFDDPTPKVIVMVAGGVVPDEQATALSNELEEQKSGVRNYGKLVIVEAVRQDPKVISENPLAAGGIPKIESLDLGTGLPEDLFVQQDTANEKSIGAATRTPPLLRGRDEDVNRSSAKEQDRVYEQRVAAPERRESWDDVMNTYILPELGVCTVLVESGGPSLSTDDEINQELREQLIAGSLSPNDVRPRLRIGEQFTEQPVTSETPWPDTPPAYVPLFKTEHIQRPNDENQDKT